MTGVLYGEYGRFDPEGTFLQLLPMITQKPKPITQDDINQRLNLILSDD